MSSTYLTSQDMNLVGRLLDEKRELGKLRGIERETSAARFLVRRIEQGTANEMRLRIALGRHLRLCDTQNSAVSRWDGEGGAIGKGAL
ncbi:hypothetical protein [Aquamicrobium defluvii]|uniref:Uncharacterized protein n=1 Tax=Aquamicrobium defluvii TaxID=69279 RepID=A0A011TJ68_9HYPH|nr:hypothetical protein [Aquamicrobium defluvii]EXL04022.1 hypothetical protein BG36_11315 [Aquamicrobium defluvii]EZQ13786.1 hypothetical protein CF98_23900 [Halopseudomonas bauzanensis]